MRTKVRERRAEAEAGMARAVEAQGGREEGGFLALKPKAIRRQHLHKTVG